MQVQDDPKFTWGEWVKELHFYIFDDTQHDSLFAQNCFMLQWEHMTSSDQVSPIKQWVWSNGCVAQFKSTWL
jgi:hypothetical protein